MQEFDTKETLISVAKSAFSLIPFAGTALTELVFDYNGRIKQNRLNKFVELLSEYFSQDQNVKIENIKTEDFNDLFESVIRKVITTKSEDKIKRYRDILIKELNAPSEKTELTSLYLDLIETLSEEEIIILEGFSNLNREYYARFDKQSELEIELSNIKEELKSKPFLIPDKNYELAIKTLQNEIISFSTLKESLKKYSEANNYSITESEFTFFKQRLFSKGLLMDEGLGRIGINAFEIMMITDFGIEFLNFIKTKNGR